MAYPLRETSISTKELIGVSFSGDIIHPEWSNHIGRLRKPRKGSSPIFKPDLLAIAIYANIVYWYRPIEIRTDNEETSYLQKYKGEHLQKSYTAYQKKWGVSRDQVKKAIDLLEELDLISRDVKGGKWLYIQLNVNRFFEITNSDRNGVLGLFNPPQSEVLGLNNPPITKNTKETNNTNLSPTDLPDEKDLPKEEKKPTDHQLMTTTLAEVMNIDTDIIDIWKRYGRFASALLKKYTPEQVRGWYGPGGWWYLHHDFGKDGQYPSEGLIKTTIKTASEFTAQKTELTPEVKELENHFENLTGFFVLPYGVRRENEWIKPCQALLSRTPDLPAAKKLMSDALQFAREEKYTVKAPSSLLTIALNMNGSGSNSGAHAIDDEIGGCYV